MSRTDLGKLNSPSVSFDSSHADKGKTLVDMTLYKWLLKEAKRSRRDTGSSRMHYRKLADSELSSVRFVEVLKRIALRP
ncbi:hypothetical protein [Roseateles sp. MS654]|uniref:hypothetical protein n=1 Tax=Roseateles sp. MS654 TaxID=3412685 RepID=UPI003C2B1975